MVRRILYCTHTPFRDTLLLFAKRKEGYPNLYYGIYAASQPNRGGQTQAPDTRSPAARGGGTDKQKTFLHTHTGLEHSTAAGCGAPPHPRNEKALPAAMARGESGRSPIGAGAWAATGTGSPGSCATISATAPSGTWLSEVEGEAWGEGAGASEGEGQLS